MSGQDNYRVYDADTYGDDLIDLYNLFTTPLHLHVNFIHDSAMTTLEEITIP